MSDQMYPRNDTLAADQRAGQGGAPSYSRSSVPEIAGLPAWTPYDAATRPTMILDDECRIENDARQADRLALERYPLYAPEDSARRD